MTGDDPSLFDDDDGVELNAAEGWRRAQEGQARAEQGRAQLAAAMDEAAERACRACSMLCADQVWRALGSIPASRGAASALGPAMRRAVARGWMEPTGDFRLSERPAAHRKPLPLYRSLIYGRVS